jgi:hypothetical protein
LRDLGQNRNAHPHFRREVKFDVNGCRSMELAFFRAVERCTAVPIPFGNTDVWHHNQANTISFAFSVHSQMSLYMRHRSGYACPRALTHHVNVLNPMGLLSYSWTILYCMCISMP